MIRASLLKAGFLLLALGSLAGCNFTPVYGGQGAGLANAGPITIAEISGRTGHYLRNELVRTVGPGVPGFSQGNLEVNFSQTIDRLAFAPDQAASRSDYVGKAEWTLRAPNGSVLASGNVLERASFNFADAAYADLAAQTAAQERLAGLLARSIRAELIMAAGRPKPPPTPATPATATPAPPPPAPPPPAPPPPAQ
jgi:LPS-assembly lipoprotein